MRHAWATEAVRVHGELTERLRCSRCAMLSTWPGARERCQGGTCPISHDPAWAVARAQRSAETRRRKVEANRLRRQRQRAWLAERVELRDEEWLRRERR